MHHTENPVCIIWGPWVHMVQKTDLCVCVCARQHTITTHSQHVSVWAVRRTSRFLPHRGGFAQCSATKDAIMATCLAVAVSSVPADRWPDGSLSLTSHPCLRPCRFCFIPNHPTTTINLPRSFLLSYSIEALGCTFIPLALNCGTR